MFNKDNFLVDKKGQVYIKDKGNFIQVAEIPVYTAVGDRAFISIGDNLFTPSAGVEVQRTTDFDIYQGSLEGSNVDIATEFSEMILTQRAFELSSRGVKTADEMWGMINNMRAR